MLILGNVFTDAVSHMFHWILLWLDGVIYWAASKCYQLFMMLSSARIFEDEFFANFARRIYAILGVFMLFYLAYALLMAIVDPDKYSKGDKGVGNIAINFVVSLVILGLVPTIFSYAYRLQNFILSEDLMGTIILGTPLNDDNSDVVDFGDSVSFTVLNTFINPGNVNVNMGKQQSFTWWDCKKEIMENSEYGCLTGIAYPYVYQNTNDDIKYYGLVSTLVGVYLVYILLTFTLDLGVRVVKLAFYQLIAPIPIIMRALPSKKDSFNKWLKKTISTYADVFIRVGFMYMSVYFINRIVLNNELGDYLNGGPVGLLVLCVIIMGIFTFAKSITKEISDILGVDANLKFGIKDKLKASGPLGNIINDVAGNVAGRTTGLVTGAAGAGWTAFVNKGTLGSAMKYGAIKGFQNKGMQFDAQRKGMYTEYGLKGPAGFFGGRAWLNTKEDEFKNAAQNDYAHPETGTNSRWLQRIENDKNSRWSQIFNEKITENINNVPIEYRDAVTNVYNANKDKNYDERKKEYKAAIEGYDETIAKMDFALKEPLKQAREKYVASLEEKRKTAAATGNTAEVTKLNSQIEEAQHTDYVNPEMEKFFSQQTAEYGGRTWSITELQQERSKSANQRDVIKNVLDLEDTTRNDTIGQYGKENPEYKRRAELRNQEINEARDKSWKLTDEGRRRKADIDAITKALKDSSNKK